jgi:protein gp37
MRAKVSIRTNRAVAESRGRWRRGPVKKGELVAKNTSIEWCNHTKNLWWGCVEVSEECGAKGSCECYARSMSEWLGFKIWGHDEPRRLLKQEVNDVLQWDKAAAKTGENRRVFWESMGDLMEDRRDLDWSRELAFDVMTCTRNLTHMILTKRPQNFERLLPAGWYRNPPTHVWGGVTVGLQKSDWRLPYLLQTGFSVKYVSNEPLLAPVDFTRVNYRDPIQGEVRLNALTGQMFVGEEMVGFFCGGGLGWVISGGQSGNKAAASPPDWFRKVRDDCGEYGVPWWFKQWGEWSPLPREGHKRVPHADIPAGDGTHHRMFRVGKKLSGAVLDGREHREFPRVRS